MIAKINNFIANTDWASHTRKIKTEITELNDRVYLKKLKQLCHQKQNKDNWFLIVTLEKYIDDNLVKNYSWIESITKEELQEYQELPDYKKPKKVKTLPPPKTPKQPKKKKEKVWVLVPPGVIHPKKSPKEQYKEYYQKHKEEIRQRCLEYYHKHKEERQAYKKEYYKNHKEQILQNAKEYYYGNKENCTDRPDVSQDNNQ